MSKCTPQDKFLATPLIPYSAGGPNRSAEVSLLPPAEVSPAEVIAMAIKKLKDLPLFISLFLFAKLQFNLLVSKVGPNILTTLSFVTTISCFFLMVVKLQFILNLNSKSANSQY